MVQDGNHKRQDIKGKPAEASDGTDAAQHQSPLPPPVKASAWKPAVKPATNAWGKSPSASSQNDTAGFPSLSSAKGQPKRHRHSPWAPKPSINPYPPRSQEIAHRWLARDGADADILSSSSSSSSASTSADPSRSATPSNQRKTGVFSLRDIDNPPALLAGLDGDDDAPDADFYKGPVQMYGMSRVTVRDLSDPSLKGKNKVRREDISENGPQIYGRHYQPHVQKGRRPRAAVQAELDEQRAIEQLGDDFGLTLDILDNAIERQQSDSQGSATLQEIVAEAQRELRLQAAQSRLGTVAAEPPDPFLRLYAKLGSDLASPQSVMRAVWLKGDAPTIGPLLEGLPFETHQRTHAAMQQSLLRLAASIRSNASDVSSLSALLRASNLCVALQYHVTAHDVFSSLLRSLEVVLSENEGEDCGKPLRDHEPAQTRALVTAIVSHADLLLEQHRFTAVEAYSRRVLTACVVLRHFRQATKRDLKSSLPSSAFYLTELIQPFHSGLVEDGFLSVASYRFLLPLPTKIRLLKGRVASMRETARKQDLWASFYAPGAAPQHRRSSNEDASTVTLHVNRSDLGASTLEALSSLKPWQFQLDLRVKFIGDGEEGVDSILGGVRKEWFTRMLSEFFDYGVLTEQPHGFATLASDADVDLAWCLGVILGWSLLHQIPFGVALPDHILSHGLNGDGDDNDGDDDAAAARLAALAQYDPRLVDSLNKMRVWRAPPGSSPSQAEALFEQTFAINFTATTRSDGKTITAPLCTGGHHRHVTPDNLDEYIGLLSRHLLYDCVREQLEALHDGLLQVFPADSPGRALLQSYAMDEIRNMIQGDPAPLRVDQIRARVEVIGSRNNGTDAQQQREDDELLKWFWAAIPRLELQQRQRGRDDDQDQASAAAKTPPSDGSFFPRELLSYITSSTHLAPASSNTTTTPFRIHLVSLPPYVGDMPVAPLPWTSTCTMTLFLPRNVYRDENHLKERLETALRLSDGGGFGLK